MSDTIIPHPVSPHKFGDSLHEPKKRRTLEERFWSGVDRSGGDDACWTWQRSRNYRGYGQIGVAGRMEAAHRVAYELAVGEIPAGRFVCHHCDNPVCCNPRHLWLGTNSDNIQDAIRKGRHNHGDGTAKLTAEQVVEIRRRHEVEGVSQYALAQEYGVTHTTIGFVVRRRTWAHVPAEEVIHG